MPSTTSEHASVNESPPNGTVRHSDEHTDSIVRARRARVALACQRCKKRKQKCDGRTPSCSNCLSFNAICQYVKPLAPMSRHREPYVRAAEERVAELESVLAREGILDEGRDRWQQLRSSQHSQYPVQQETFSPESRRPSKRLCVEASSQYFQDQEDHETGPIIATRNVNSVEDILRDLSLEASGGYVGASSSITMSRMVRSLVKAKAESQAPSSGFGIEEHLSPKSLSDCGLEHDALLELGSMSPEIANKLLKGYLKHIATRWPILHSNYLRGLHARRSNLVTSYEKTVLHLVYASGGRFLETTGETGPFFPDRHHSAGMQYLDELLQYHDTRSIQVLILLAIYSLRAPEGPGAYLYIGLAMRACVELGLHRRTLPKRYTLLEIEMRRRIFWTCYCLDRQISIILGRPFAISDRDIDNDLPLDVDESTQENVVFEAALASQSVTIATDQPPAVSTSLSCFIHICRLRRIESQIQQSIYRVDESTGATEDEVESYIEKLEDWREKIPRDARHHNADKATTQTDTKVIDGYGYYMVYYHKCMRFLLHPLLSAPDTNLRFLKKCAEACGDVCQTYKRLHQSIPVGFSLMALHSVFLAGLTLIYCAWISPQEVFNIKTSNDMNACSIVLYIITERWPGAKKYRDTYEATKQSLLESVEEGKYEPRRVIKRLYPDCLPSMASNEEGSKEVTRMIADMTGEAMPQGEENATSPVPAAAHSHALMKPPTASETLVQDFSLPIDFAQLPAYDETLFSFDDLDSLNGLDVGDFNMSMSHSILQ